MSVLGTMMLRAGLLSEGQVAAVSEQAASRACSEADAILELGLADEDTLVAFLASKLMIPRVRTSVLERVDQATHSRLPAIVAWDHKCMPVSADELGNLTVVMADPTDPRAIEAIAQHTDAYLIRAVSTVSDLTRALERHYGPEYAVRERAARAQQGIDVAESSRPTELELTPIRDHAGPQVAAPPVAAPPVAAPPVAAPHEAGPAIGIPDDDDDVPVRVGHGVAEEIVSGPHEQAYDPPPAAPYMAAPYVSQTPAAPYVSQTPAAPYVSTPSWSEPPPAATQPDSDDDPHARPTVVEAHTPSRGPRRARAHTPWNPPLAGPGQTIPPHSPRPEPAPPAPPPPPLPEPEPAPPPPEPEPQVAIPPVVIPEPASLPIVPLSPEAFAEVLPQLEVVTDRDEVTTVLLDFLAAGFDRVILFVHSHNELRGLDARGKDLLVEAVRQVRIPTTGASSFSEAIERGSPYFGPANSTHKIDQAFSQALGGIRGNVLLLPIALGNKVPLLLWAHGTSHPVDPRSIHELSAAVSTAILRIIAAARRKG